MKTEKLLITHVAASFSVPAASTPTKKWSAIYGRRCCMDADPRLNVLQGENITLTQRSVSGTYVSVDQFHAGPIHGPTRANLLPQWLAVGRGQKKRARRFLDEVETYVSVAQKMPKIIPENWAFIYHRQPSR